MVKMEMVRVVEAMMVVIVVLTRRNSCGSGCGSRDGVKDLQLVLEHRKLKYPRT